MLIYLMGNESDDILRSFAANKKYQMVMDKFEAHFVNKRNIIYERARFNMKQQEEGEPVDTITVLYRLAEHCGYNNLHDEMIRDRTVVGISNAQLSEKLQLDSELTLEKAIAEVWQSEAIKQQQQPLLRGGGSVKHETPVGAVAVKAFPFKGKGSQNVGASSNKQPGSSSHCTRCGKIPAHDRRHCPAKDAICQKCKKRGHY